MQFDLSKILTMINDISSLVSFQTSKQHSYDIISVLLQEIASVTHSDYTYLTFTMKNTNIKDRKFSRSYGIPEEQCMVFNQIIDEIIAKGGSDVTNQYLFPLNELIGIKQFYDIGEVKTAIRIPIMSSDLLDGYIYAYFTKEQQINPEIFEFLSSIAGLISNSVISRETFLTELNRVSSQQEYFQKLYNSVLILDENLFILRTNEAGAELLGGYRPSENMKFNIAEHVSNETLSSILAVLDDLKINELSKEISVRWILDPKESNNSTVNVVFGFTKLLKSDDFTQYIASGRITQLKETLTIKSRSDLDFDLLSKLSEFKNSYLENAQDTLKVFKTEFFPAAYVMLVNEITGPLPMQSSPDIELMNIMPETIRILAAVNTSEIINQGYITGSTLWAKPNGELKWIAFSRNNPKARGNVEFHVIGIVVERNLIAVMPQLNQLIFGILLSGMNNYIQILDDDKADFVTVEFVGDRFFSTLSLIRNNLEEIRDFASELFAASLTGYETAF
ncbi:MAG: hypothetical protein GPJ54_00585 [Candidatus Heimdallarchaeota archaeon]|nr:hypothetical protein [Candidatus Heimdallarchaeota archaeon]